MLRPVLFHLLMSLPPSTHTPEAHEAREARMHTVANAVADASEELTCYKQDRCKRRWPGSAQEMALVLTTIAWHESGFDLDVHAGRCKNHQCDPVRRRGGEVLRFKAASLWQIHSNALVPLPVWATLSGTDEESTRLAALTAGRLAAGARGMCTYQHRGGDWLHMTFAAYGTGSVCRKESAKLRVATFYRFSKKVEAIRAELRRQS
jgi:hypothetical protein